ncbi:MAG: methyltransferase domain-containing protein [Haloarculaceae archaeon]
MNSDDTFDKKMSDVDWESVYERQAARGGLTTRFCDLLGLEKGDSVLELGSGPGYMTAQLADEISPGNVYALDRQVGALRYLQDNATRHPSCIHPLCGDVAALPLRFSDPITTIATFLLHHLAEPGAALEAIASVLPPGSPFLIAEYHPAAAGDFGPPLDHRLAPEQVQNWLSESGFTHEDTVALPEEKYAIISRR